MTLMKTSPQIERPFAMLPGFDNTPKVTDAPSTVLPAEKPTLFLRKPLRSSLQHSLMTPRHQLSH